MRKKCLHRFSPIDANASLWETFINYVSNPMKFPSVNNRILECKRCGHCYALSIVHYIFFGIDLTILFRLIIEVATHPTNLFLILFPAIVLILLPVYSAIIKTLFPWKMVGESGSITASTRENVIRRDKICLGITVFCSLSAAWFIAMIFGE